jgi:hypothetical protein
VVPIGPVVSENEAKLQKLTTTDDGRQVMAIPHMTFWVRLAIKEFDIPHIKQKLSVLIN